VATSLPARDCLNSSAIGPPEEAKWEKKNCLKERGRLPKGSIGQTANYLDLDLFWASKEGGGNETGKPTKKKRSGGGELPVRETDMFRPSALHGSCFPVLSPAIRGKIQEKKRKPESMVDRQQGAVGRAMEKGERNFFKTTTNSIVGKSVLHSRSEEKKKQKGQVEKGSYTIKTKRIPG